MGVTMGKKNIDKPINVNKNSFTKTPNFQYVFAKP
jgi:hypothetical protein